MKTEIRLSTESPYILLLKYNIRELAKIIYLVLKPFIKVIVFILENLIYLWHDFYEFIFSKRKKLLQVWFLILGLYVISFSIVLCVQIFIYDKFPWETLWILLGIIGGGLGLVLALVLYHLIIGHDRSEEHTSELQSQR